MPQETIRRHPTIQVKIITYSGTHIIRNAEKEVDSELVSVSTTKSLNAPAGTFTIQSKMLKDKDNLTLYHKVKPMDMVEISMSFTKFEEPVVVMRGLVDDIRRGTHATEGKVTEVVNIVGRDMGKLFLIHRAYYFKAMEVVDKFFAEGKYGLEAGQRLTLPEIIKEIFTKIFQNSSDLKFTNGQSVGDLIHLLITAGKIGNPRTTDLVAFTNPLQTAEGNIWSLFQMYQGMPFNEMFVRDDYDKTRLVIRPALLKDFHGRFTQKPTFKEAVFFAFDIAGVRISSRDIFLYDIGRSDREVKNFFFTYPKNMYFSRDAYKGSAIGDFIDIEGDTEVAKGNPFYGNRATDLADRHIYGFRPMDVDTDYIAIKRNGTKEDLQGKGEGSVSDAVKIGKELNKIIVGNYVHNAYLESGTISVIGDHRYRIGYYLTVEDWEVPGHENEFYIEGVSHKFDVMKTWTTTLSVTRGNGWIKRFGQQEQSALALVEARKLKTLKVNESAPPATPAIAGSNLDTAGLPA